MRIHDYTIALVEDDSSDVLLFRQAFKKAGMHNHLVVLEDGEAAIRYLRGEGPYTDRQAYPLPLLMLLDLRLPKVSGFEVLEWLRAQPVLKRLRVVVFSSSRMDEDIDRAYDLGANSYLEKPSGFEALLEMVKAIHEYWIVLSEYPNVHSD